MAEYTYTVLYEHFEDEGRDGYNVVVPALPGCVTWGRTLEEAKEMARDAIRCYIDGLLKDGEPVPSDNSETVMAEIERVTVAA